MGSVHYTVPARSADYAKEIAQVAKELIEQHGKDADAVAARRADALCREGNTAEGTKWLDIFKLIAHWEP
jgi:hypothetical protein